MISFETQFEGFAQLADSLEANAFRSQILVQVTSKRDALRDLMGLLHSMGVQTIEHTILSEDNPVCILFHLKENDVSEIVINLIEAGYEKVKGVNSKRMQ